MSGLSRFRYLSVVASASAVGKGEAGDERALGARLGARYVLEGASAGEAPTFASAPSSSTPGRERGSGPRPIVGTSRRRACSRCRTTSPHASSRRSPTATACSCIRSGPQPARRTTSTSRRSSGSSSTSRTASRSRPLLRGAQEPAGARGGAGRPSVRPVGLPRAGLRRRIRVRLRGRRDVTGSGAGGGPPRGRAGSGEPVRARRAGAGALLPAGPRGVRPGGRARDGPQPAQHRRGRDPGAADRAHRRVRARRRDRAPRDGAQSQPRGLDALRSALGALPQGRVRAGPRAREPGGRARPLLALSRRWRRPAVTSAGAPRPRPRSGTCWRSIPNSRRTRARTSGPGTSRAASWNPSSKGCARRGWRFPRPTDRRLAAGIGTVTAEPSARRHRLGRRPRRRGLLGRGAAVQVRRRRRVTRGPG